MRIQRFTCSGSTWSSWAIWSGVRYSTRLRSRVCVGKSASFAPWFDWTEKRRRRRAECPTEPRLAWAGPAGSGSPGSGPARLVRASRRRGLRAASRNDREQRRRGSAGRAVSGCRRPSMEKCHLPQGVAASKISN